MVRAMVTADTASRWPSKMRTPNSGNATDSMAMCHRKMP